MRRPRGSCSAQPLSSLSHYNCTLDPPLLHFASQAAFAASLPQTRQNRELVNFGSQLASVSSWSSHLIQLCNGGSRRRFASSKVRKPTLKQLLRKLLMKIHPDRLPHHPIERQVNDNSLQLLNNFLTLMSSTKTNMLVNTNTSDMVLPKTNLLLKFFISADDPSLPNSSVQNNLVEPSSKQKKAQQLSYRATVSVHPSSARQVSGTSPLAASMRHMLVTSPRVTSPSHPGVPEAPAHILEDRRLKEPKLYRAPIFGEKPPPIAVSEKGLRLVELTLFTSGGLSKQLVKESLSKFFQQCGIESDFDWGPEFFTLPHIGQSIRNEEERAQIKAMQDEQ